MSAISNENFDVFLTLQYFKNSIGATDLLDDSTYLAYVNEANKEVHTKIFSYIDTPIGIGSIYFSRCRDAALQFARAQHSLNRNYLERSTAYENRFKIIIDSIIEELIATRTNRTETILITKDPREIKIPLPTQTDIFTFDRFG